MSWTKEEWLEWGRCASIRAIKTSAQTAAATIGTAMALSDVDWRLVVSASLLAGLLSLLTSLAGLPELDKKKKRMEGEDDEDCEALSADDPIAALKEEDDDVEEDDEADDDLEDPDDDEVLPQ